MTANMRVNFRFKTIMCTVILFFISLSVNAAELPTVDFSHAKWKIAKGMTLKNGVLRMEGKLGEYRRALLKIPSSTVGKIRFYVTANIKSQNVKQGKSVYQLPKIKIYYENRPDTRKASLVLPGTHLGWNAYGLGYQAKHGQQENLILEISMESCQGVAYVKDLKLTHKRPPDQQVFPFNIPSNPVCKLDIKTTRFRKFNNDLLGLNSHFVGFNKKLNYADPRIARLIGKIKIPLLRFPGGTVANWYDYQTDMWALTPNAIKAKTKLMSRLKEGIATGRRFMFNQYLAMSKKYGFKTTLVINVLHDSPEKSAARVKERLDRGLTFPWVELGNENIYPAQQSMDIHSVETYIKKCKAVTAAIKKVDPNVMIAVNIHEADEPNWGLPMARETFYDAVVMHPYSSIGRNEISFNIKAMQLGLSAYTQLLPKIQKYQEIYGNKPLLLTEWGVLGSSRNLRNHLAAIGTADMFFGIIENWENGPVVNACLHIFSGGYMGLYDSDRKTNELYKRPYAVMYDMMIKAYRNNDIFSAQSTSVVLDQELGLHAVMARATKNNTGLMMIFAVNKLPVTSSLELALNGEAYTGKYTLQAFSNMNLRKQTRYGINENPCKITRGKGNKVILPPYSINLVTLR